MWMRGGTSKGGYFLEGELPEGPAERDAFLLRIMGSPDPRQIDGLGGAASLTSKVAVVSAGREPGIDVEYQFLQVFVDRPLVSAAQTCGNILAGVGPFAIERGLVAARRGETEVVIRNTNTGQIVRAAVPTPGGKVCYEGGTAIDGVPGTASPIPLFIRGMAGSKCGALLPSGNRSDRIEGVECTLIDNGMPAVLIRASDLGIAGDEPPEALEGNAELKALVEQIRLAAGPRMALGDVGAQPVPKMCLLSAPLRWWRPDDPLLHSACLPPDHRGALCRVGSDGLAAGGSGCGGRGARSRRQRGRGCHRASERQSDRGASS